MAPSPSQNRVTIRRSPKSIGLGLLLVLTLLSSLLTAFFAPPHQAQALTNTTLNFQARLQTSSGAIVPDGYYNVEFKLYSAASGGTALWTETYYDTNGVTAGNDFRIRVQNGYLTTSLGSLTAFPTTINWDQQLWITMNIGGSTQTATPTYDGEMNPRLQLTGVPYAFRAGQLATGNGSLQSTLQILQPTVGNQTFQIQDQGAAGTFNLCIQNSTACGFAAATGGAGYIQNTSSPQAGSNFNISGNGVIGGNLSVNGANKYNGVFDINAGTAGWVKLGTLTLPQGGEAANIKVFAGQNYNASPNQDAQLDINFRTSNTFNVNGNGFAGQGTYSRYGGRSTFTDVKVKGNAAGGSATTYDVFVYFNSFPGNGFVTVQTGPNGSWSNGIANATDPGADSSTVLSLLNSTTINQNLTITGTGINIAANNTLLKPTTNSTTTFQIQNASATPVLTVDTINQRLSLQASNASSPALSILNSDGSFAIEFRAGGSGQNNTLVGLNAGSAVTTGNFNSAFGSLALSFNTSGAGNTAIGKSALYSNTTGGGNTATGQDALNVNTTGFNNTAMGNAALYINASGSNNTAVGKSALLSNTTGSLNSAIGYNAGNIDTDAFITPSSLSNTTILGANAQSFASNSVILGGAGSNAVNVGIGTPNPTNTLSVSPVQYGAGGPAGNGTTASQSGTTVTGTGTTFTSAMVGSEIVFRDGTKATITAFGSATSLTVTPSQTVTSQIYRIHYAGLQVTNGGNVGIGTTAPGYRLDVQGGDINTSGAFRVGGLALASTNLGDSATLARTNAANSFSAINTFNAGAAISGAATTINANSNFNTSINTGTSTGLVSIGGNAGTFALDTTNIDISAAGAITGATGLVFASGNFNQNGSGTFDTGTGAVGLNGNTTVSLGKTFTTNGNNLLGVAGALGSTTVNDRLVIGGTTAVTYAATHRAQITGVMQSTVTATQYGLQENLNFNPQGASLTNIYGAAINPVLSGSALNITKFSAINASVDTTSGYTGLLSSAYGLEIAAPSIAGSQLVPDYRGISVSGVTSNSGNTTGLIENAQLRFNGNSAGAGAGGTLINYGIYNTLGTGNTAGTTNYGLYLTGSGGASAGGNFAIYSTSNAASYLKGTLMLGGGTAGYAAPAAGIGLQLSGTNNGINTTGSYYQNGTAGSTTTCTGGQILQNTVVAGGIVTGGTCVAPGSGGGATSVAFSTTQNANGGSISGGVLTLAEAGTTNPGLISGNAQTFNGAKTFNSSINTSTGNAYQINSQNVLSASALNFTAASAGTIQSAAGQALNVVGNAASTIATTAGVLTLQTGDTSAVLVKSTSNSATAFQVQNSSGVTFLNVSTASQTLSLRSADATTAVFNLLNNDGSVALEMRSGGIGLNNSYIGLNTGMTNTTGSNNTAFGINGLQLNTTGVGNTSLGALTLNNNTSGAYNTAIGGGALGNNTTGNYNVAIGTDAGRIDNDGFTTQANLNNSMAIGFQSQVQASNTLILGGAGSQQIKVGVGTTIARNTLSIEPLQYNTGTASQSGTTVTGTGTTFTAAMVGSHITFANGFDASITAFNSATSLTVNVSQTVATQNYRIHYNGLQVANNGRVGVGTATPGYQLDVAGDINTNSTYRIAGTAGSTTTCTGGQILQNTVVAGGIVTGGTCVAPGSGGGATSVAFSTTQNANGGSISGGVLTLAEAGTTNPGLISGNAQTFNGAKTFNSSINTSTGNAYQINSQNVLSASALNFTAASAGTINAAASQALNLTGNAASTFATTAGALTINGFTNLNLNALGGAATITGTTGVSITTGGNITLGTVNTTGTLLVLDEKTTATDPTGVNGGMYYNSSRGKFRCYEKSAWRDCLSPWTVITKSADQDVTNSSALVNDSELQFSVVANTTYIMNFYIVTSGSSATGDYEYQFTFPANDTTSNTSGRVITTGTGNGISSSSGQLGSTTGWPAASSTTGTTSSLTSKRVLEGYVSFQPLTSGTMNFTFAQATAGGTGTIARTNAGSFIEYVAIP